MLSSERVRRYIATLIGCLIALSAFFTYKYATRGSVFETRVKAGFIYIGDASNGYTTNFMEAQKNLEAVFKNRVITTARYNVPADEVGKTLDELARLGCGIIFTNSYGYGETVKEFAKNHPEIQFCQATQINANTKPFVSNYHTFMGHIHEGRYASGVAAGMKLKDLIDAGRITVSQAKVGYVAAYPYPEVISGYTAFLLGVRSVVPEAVMTVMYTNSWNNYTLEKKYAKELIEQEGCVIISQHSDTMGPATACEEEDRSREVYCVSYNESMSDIAPTTYLTGTRINWEPYITQAVKAVLENRKIESALEATINGNDAGSGFKNGWVRMLEINYHTAAKGTKERLEKLTEAFAKGNVHVFSGPYRGTDPENASDTISLTKEYTECKDQSAPSFHYVLDDVIKIRKPL